MEYAQQTIVQCMCIYQIHRFLYVCPCFAEMVSKQEVELRNKRIKLLLHSSKVGTVNCCGKSPAFPMSLHHLSISIQATYKFWSQNCNRLLTEGISKVVTLLILPYVGWEKTEKKIAA